MTLGQETPAGLEDMLGDLLRFPLMEALTGRRSRRFCMGAEIPDGVFAFKSKHKSIPLSELEQSFVTIDHGRSYRMAFCYNAS